MTWPTILTIPLCHKASGIKRLDIAIVQAYGAQMNAMLASLAATDAKKEFSEKITNVILC